MATILANIIASEEERAELEHLVEVLGDDRAQHAAEDHALTTLLKDVQREAA
jgi:hypothetical protein